MQNTTTIKKTPLYSRHIALGGKIVEFAGFYLPIEYSGIINEHNRVREKAGIFDLTHMGEIEIQGETALDLVQKIITNDASRLEMGGVLYTAVCGENGGVLDDILVYRLKDRYMLVVNAVNVDKIFDWIMKHRENETARNISDDLVLIAVQGPLAVEIVRKVVKEDVSNLNYYNSMENMIEKDRVLISRTGYTGEDGFELYIKPELGEKAWDLLMKAGEPHEMLPIGLGARDTLRLESRYCLYGHELSGEINPLEAGLGWVVKFDKGDFIGRDALLKIKKEKPGRKLIGFKMVDKGIPREHFDIYKDSEKIGYVTSGTFSPTLKVGIGLGLIDSRLGAPGEEILIEVRKKFLKARIIKGAFYKGSVKR